MSVDYYTKANFIAILDRESGEIIRSSWWTTSLVHYSIKRYLFV